MDCTQKPETEVSGFCVNLVEMRNVYHWPAECCLIVCMVDATQREKTAGEADCNIGVNTVFFISKVRGFLKDIAIKRINHFIDVADVAAKISQDLHRGKFSFDVGEYHFFAMETSLNRSHFVFGCCKRNDIVAEGKAIRCTGITVAGYIANEAVCINNGVQVTLTCEQVFELIPEFVFPDNCFFP